jgi:RNA polymerase sigma-70 factor, ECF subfamily
MQNEQNTLHLVTLHPPTESYLMNGSQPDPETGDRWLKWCNEALVGNRLSEAQFLGEVRSFFRAIALKQSWRRDQEATETSDIAQDCCLKLPSLLHQFRGTTGVEFIAWLRTIVRNGSLDAVRKVNARMRGGGLHIGALPTDANEDVAIAADTSTPSKELTRQEEYQQFQEALEQLSGDHKEVIRLRLLLPDKLTWAEIARRMNRSEDAVKQLFQRAYKELIRLSDKLRDNP